MGAAVGDGDGEQRGGEGGRPGGRGCGGGPAEPLEALVDDLTAALDQPVGVEHDGVARPDGDLTLDVGAGDRGVEPDDAGDRGGALQTLVFVLVLLGIALISGLIVRESRRKRSERGF